MSAKREQSTDLVRITATDLATGDSDSHEVWDDYVIVAVGSAEVTNFQVTAAADGSATHVITVTGVHRG